MCLAPKTPAPVIQAPPPPPPPAPPPAPDPVNQNEQQLKDQQTATVNTNRTGRQSLLIPMNPLGGTSASTGLNIPA